MKTPNPRLFSVVPTLLCIAAVLVLSTIVHTAAAATTTPLRLVFAPRHQLQPLGKYNSPCSTVSDGSPCKGGWARLNALIRSEQTSWPYGASSFASIVAFDDQSNFVGFHPKGFVMNDVMFQRTVGAKALLVGYYMYLNPNEKRVMEYSAQSTNIPILSNLEAPAIVVADGINTYKLITTGDNHKVLILNMYDSKFKAYSFRDEMVVANKIIPILTNIYDPDLVVMKRIISDPLTTFANETVSPLVDVIIAADLSCTQTSGATRINTTWIVCFPDDSDVVTGFDWNPLTKSVTAVRRHSLEEEIPTALQDAAYAADMAFLQTEVTRADHSDPIIGYCPVAMPSGTPQCRIRACEHGEMWTNVMYGMAPATDIDIAIMNGGSYRQGWEAGDMHLSSLFASYPFADSSCTFKLWGSDVWRLYNFSVSAAPLTGDNLDGYANTGRMLQSKNARVVYNPQLETEGKGTRIASISILNRETGEYEPLSRRRQYKIVANQYLCGGGDGFGPYVGHVEQERISFELHTLAQVWIGALDNATLTPKINEGSLVRDFTASKAFLLNAITQKDCGINTYYIPDVHDCEPCAVGQYQPLTGQLQCIDIPPDSVNFGLIIGVIIPAVVVVIACLVTYMYLPAYLQRMAAPRDGVATVMFTDIESSSNLWSHAPGEMGDVIEQHHAIIRKCIGRRGYEVKTIGDAFMIACKDPKQALQIALDIQSALHKAKWPDFIQEFYDRMHPSQVGVEAWKGLRVRVGMHMGEAQSVTDEITKRVDYYGSAINIAARVESKAKGGEVLCSRDHIDVLDEDYLNQFVFKSTGKQELKGIPEPIELFLVLPANMEDRTIVEEVTVPKPMNPASVALNSSMSMSTRKVSVGGSVAGGSTEADEFNPRAVLNKIGPMLGMHPLVIGGMDEDVLTRRLSEGIVWLTSILQPMKSKNKANLLGDLASAWKVSTGNAARDLTAVILRAVGGVIEKRALMSDLVSMDQSMASYQRPDGTRGGEAYETFGDVPDQPTEMSVRST
eukprot:PhM_4_TR11676/c0_g2_i1/m.13384